MAFLVIWVLNPEGFLQSLASKNGVVGSSKSSRKVQEKFKIEVQKVQDSSGNKAFKP